MSYVYYIIAVSIAWLLINVIYQSKRSYFTEKNLKIIYGIVLVYRKTSVVKTQRVFFKKILFINITLFVIILAIFYYSMIASFLIKTGYLKGMPAQILIPGVNITGIDLVFFILSIAIAATVHELTHAYSATLCGVRVKSIGFAIVFIIPIAFTEVDEDDFRKTSSLNRVVVLSAGPASNYLIALIATALLAIATTPSGLAILEVQSSSLAEKYGLKPGDIILRVNDIDATLSSLSMFMSIENATDVKLLIISNKEFREIIIHKPSGVTKLGVRLVSKPSDQLINLFGQYNSLLLILAIIWIHIVNLGLAIINAAPLFISDGGRIFYEVFKNKNIGHFVNTVSLLILLLGVAPIQ